MGSLGGGVICLAVVTDGRDGYLERTVASAREMLPAESLLERVMYDDTGDEAYRKKLQARYPEFLHIDAGPRQGFGGAIRFLWDWLASHSNARYILHLEQDFLFRRPVPLDDLEWLLEERPQVAQVALKRQPWNDQERLAGGVIEQHPEAYEDREVGGRRWVEHTLFWTTNPSLYRRSLCKAGWPEGAQSEGRFGHGLRTSGTPEESDGERIRFAYWGAREEAPHVEHIGEERRGTGY